MILVNDVKGHVCIDEWHWHICIISFPIFRTALCFFPPLCILKAILFNTLFHVKHLLSHFGS